MENLDNTNEISLNNNIEKENGNKKSIFKKIKLAFLIWNIFSLAIYTTFTFYAAYHNTKSPVLIRIIWILLIAYFVAFIFLIVNGIKNKIKFKTDIKNYKSSVNILKQFMKLLNVSLSIVTAVTALYAGGIANVFTITFGIISIFITCFSVFLEIFKMVLRTKITNYKIAKEQNKESKKLKLGNNKILDLINKLKNDNNDENINDENNN